MAMTRFESGASLNPPISATYATSRPQPTARRRLIGRRLSGALAIALLTLLIQAIPASLQVEASCLAAPPGFDPVAHARVAFVGTVVSATDDQHQALVRVESVWRGPQLPAEVAVQSSVLPLPGEMIEDLAVFTSGTRYLFLPENNSAPFKFAGCGGPIEYSSALDRYRPGAAHPPLSTSTLGDALQFLGFTAMSHFFLVVVIVLFLLVAVTLALRRRRKA